MNININTKNQKNLPGLKTTMIEKGVNRNTQISDESDVDLPPINKKKDYMVKFFRLKLRSYIYITNEKNIYRLLTIH